MQRVRLGFHRVDRISYAIARRSRFSAIGSDVVHDFNVRATFDLHRVATGGGRYRLRSDECHCPDFQRLLHTQASQRVSATRTSARSLSALQGRLPYYNIQFLVVVRVLVIMKLPPSPHLLQHLLQLPSPPPHLLNRMLWAVCLQSNSFADIVLHSFAQRRYCTTPPSTVRRMSRSA